MFAYIYIYIYILYINKYIYIYVIASLITVNTHHPSWIFALQNKMFLIVFIHILLNFLWKHCIKDLNFIIMIIMIIKPQLSSNAHIFLTLPKRFQKFDDRFTIRAVALTRSIDNLVSPVCIWVTVTDRSINQWHVIWYDGTDLHQPPLFMVFQI